MESQTDYSGGLIVGGGFPTNPILTNWKVAIQAMIDGLEIVSNESNFN